MRSLVTAALLAFLAACGGPRHQAAKPAPPAPGAVPSKTPEADKNYRPPNMLWWQGAQPVCSTGEFKRRSLSWGAVLWCALPGQRVDSNLQNDLGRLARCVHESVGAFQEEPAGDGLGDFLARAHESGLNPVLCAAVRRDSEVRTYHGRRVMMERAVESESDHELSVRYRFSCEECVVAAETTVRVAAP